jgi:hypothetical protein
MLCGIPFSRFLTFLDERVMRMRLSCSSVASSTPSFPLRPPYTAAAAMVSQRSTWRVFAYSLGCSGEAARLKLGFSRWVGFGSTYTIGERVGPFRVGAGLRRAQVGFGSTHMLLEARKSGVFIAGLGKPGKKPAEQKLPQITVHPTIVLFIKPIETVRFFANRNKQP